MGRCTRGGARIRQPGGNPARTGHLFHRKQPLRRSHEPPGGLFIQRLAEIAAGYGMPGFIVDGMDPLAVKMAVGQVRRLRNDGALPCFIEAETYRFYHHAGSNPGSTYGYRSKEEEAAWHARDPIAQCVERLKRMGLLDAAGEQRLKPAGGELRRASGGIPDGPHTKGAVIVRAELWPDPAHITDGLRDETSVSNGPFVEAETITCNQEIKYSDAIAAVTGRWLETDPHGSHTWAKKWQTRRRRPTAPQRDSRPGFPDRVINTPITEAGFCGPGLRRAMHGMHPVVELMFSSFGLVAADQLFNQIGQLGHIYNGHVRIPLVIRTRMAGGLGYGAQHSGDPVGALQPVPGLANSRPHHSPSIT